MIVVGGGMILISGASEKLLNQGKTVLKGAVIGVAIAMLSYVIVATFLWLIGNKGDGGDGEGISWPNVQCNVPPPPGVVPFGAGETGANGVNGTNGTNGTNTGESGTSGTSGHDAIYAELTNARIVVTTTGGTEYVRSNCDGATGPCTTLSGLPRSAIDGLKRIKSECGCAVVLVGGTEPGHREHGRGNPVVDLDNNAEIDNYIYSKIGRSNPTPFVKYRGSDGVTYMWENAPTHWHIIF